MRTANSTSATDEARYIEDTAEHTTSTGQVSYVRVATRVELGRSHLQLLAPNVPNRTQSWFERAQTSGRERDWEQYVENMFRLAESPEQRATDEEVLALWSLASTVSSSYRPAAALARAASAFLHVAQAWSHYASQTLLKLIRHPSAEVRLQVLEVVEEADIGLAKDLARIAAEDSHPDVREAAAAIRDLP